jgi:hypothetical protein
MKRDHEDDMALLTVFLLGWGVFLFLGILLKW